jgi:predicted dehydrogenase
MHQRGILDFVAVCDMVPERVSAAQNRTGDPCAYTDYDLMLWEADVDLVVNLTPTWWSTSRRPGITPSAY